MNTTTAKTLALAALLPLCASAQIVTTVLDDNFNDNDRTNQNLPSSAQWFSSTGVGGGNLALVETSSGNYALQNSSTSTTIRHAVAYFAPATTPVSLAATNDTINVSFSLTPTSGTPSDSLNILRFGLFNSGSARQDADASNPNVAVQGYGLFINPAQQRVRFYARTDDAGPLFSSLGDGSGWVDNTNNTGGFLDDKIATGAFAMEQDTTYAINITYTRLADNSIDIAYSISDGESVASTSINDTSYLNYDFDSIGFAWSNTFGAGLIDNVLVTHSSIPEPSSFAALLGLTALAGVGLRRRRHTA